MVEEMDEFEHLPDIRAGRIDEASEPDEPGDAPLNELILAGLVSPV
jgi:hypothetical protein